MSVTRKDNVIIVTANGDTVTGGIEIETLKVVGGASGGTIQIQVGGVTIYEATITASTDRYEDIHLRVMNGETATVAITGTAKLYLYTE